ncbi:MAG: type II toxin-antitoxin system RelE/ParE family toxin [Anaerolineae bacterium]
MMEIRFEDGDLDRLETELGDRGFPPEIVKAYRKLLGYLRHAQDERDLRAMKSLRFEKLKGKRQHQRSLRLNDQWRLIVELQQEGSATVLVVAALENHYR